MNYHKSKMNTLIISIMIALFSVGCGESATTSSEATSKNVRASTYITKGNFVEVARFAYKRVTNPNFTQSAFDVALPGSQAKYGTKLSVYDISTLKSDDKINKIVMQNHLNRLEVKILDNNRVNILLQSHSFTLNRKMTLTEFTATH